MQSRRQSLNAYSPLPCSNVSGEILAPAQPSTNAEKCLELRTKSVLYARKIYVWIVLSMFLLHEGYKGLDCVLFFRSHL